MLCVKESPSAPRKIYRSFRSKLRYDTEIEKGWKEHVLDVGPIRTFEAPSQKSTFGRIETIAGESLDDVDASSQLSRFTLTAQLMTSGDHFRYRLLVSFRILSISRCAVLNSTTS